MEDFSPVPHLAQILFWSLQTWSREGGQGMPGECLISAGVWNQCLGMSCPDAYSFPWGASADPPEIPLWGRTAHRCCSSSCPRTMAPSPGFCHPPHPESLCWGHLALQMVLWAESLSRQLSTALFWGSPRCHGNSLLSPAVLCAAHCNAPLSSARHPRPLQPVSVSVAQVSVPLSLQLWRVPVELSVGVLKPLSFTRLLVGTGGCEGRSTCPPFLHSSHSGELLPACLLLGPPASSYLVSRQVMG